MGCYNLVKMNGTSVCVSSPGRRYNPPTATSGLPQGSIPTTAVPVPTDIANGTTRYCAKYYDVQSGDYCNLLSIIFGISIKDFVILNPAINENCTNLYADESYCVAAVGDSEFSNDFFPASSARTFDPILG